MTRPAAPSAVPRDHYVVLGLPTGLENSPRPSTQDVKIAYKRALLRHHPDKRKGRDPQAPPAQPQPPREMPRYTIDEITLAYRVLSSPSARGEYDRLLRLRPSTFSKQSPSADASADVFHSGLEAVDLDDFEHDEERGVWFRACRCGAQAKDGNREHTAGGGFVVTEKELEDEAEFGVLVTGCAGCSLWVEVLFEVVGDDEDQDGAGDREGG